MSRIGVPVKLLHESVGHVVTVELKTGETYRGTLEFVEDNMNSQFVNVSFTCTRVTQYHPAACSFVLARDGQSAHLEAIYIRGSKIRFFVLPEMLRNAPMFAKAGIRGKAAILRAQGKQQGSHDKLERVFLCQNTTHNCSCTPNQGRCPEVVKLCSSDHAIKHTTILD